jgi:hypothetical protein
MYPIQDTDILRTVIIYIICIVYMYMYVCIYIYYLYEPINFYYFNNSFLILLTILL